MNTDQYKRETQDEILTRYKTALKDIVRVVTTASARPKISWTLEDAAEVANECYDIAHEAIGYEE